MTADSSKLMQHPRSPSYTTIESCSGPITPKNESSIKLTNSHNDVKSKGNTAVPPITKFSEVAPQVFMVACPPTLNYLDPMGDERMMSSNRTSTKEPTIELKIRYVAKDLWVNMSLPTHLKVSQVRDMCLLKCGMELDSKVPSPQSSVDSCYSSEEVMDFPRPSFSNDHHVYSEPMECTGYGLFWNGAGHWLDTFRRLESYPLAKNDVLELQLRSQFIFIPPQLYNQHYAEGSLLKLSHGLQTQWKLRWFTLQGTQLCYFRRRQEPNPIGVMDLSGSFKLECGTIDNKELSLSLQSGLKSLSLCCTNPDDFQHWRRIFSNLYEETCDQQIINVDVTNSQSPRKASLRHSQIQMDGGMLIKAGTLFRRTPITRSFRERYFVLRGKELSCYRSDRFDKQNNHPYIIALHTVDVIAYENDNKFYFKITDKQAIQQSDLLGPNQPPAKPKSRKDIGSIISSTRSLSLKAASWVSKSMGGQLDVEYLYVTDRHDWESWRAALENIAQLSVPVIEGHQTIPRKDLKAKSVKSHQSQSPSLWSKLSSNRSNQPSTSSNHQTTSSRFSNFLNLRSHPIKPSPPASTYNDIDDQTQSSTHSQQNLYEEELQWNDTNFLPSPLLPIPESLPPTPLNPADQLLTDPNRDRLPPPPNHHPVITTLSTPNPPTTHKFKWFKKP